MNDKIVKNNRSSVFNSKNRIVITLVSLVIVVAAIATIWHYVVKKNANQGYATSISTPELSSLPGSDKSSSQYVEDQNIQNQSKAAVSRKKAQSFVPTITRSNFSGSLDSFLDKKTNKPANKSSCPLKKLVVMYKPNPASCTIKNLQLAHGSGVTAEELICQGCSCPALKLAGYSVGDLKNIGFTAKQLKHCGYTLKQLVSAGFSAKDLKDAGFSVKQLAKEGFTAGQLAAVGFSPAEIMKSGGYSLKDLKAAGFTAKQLAAVGFSPAEIMKSGGYSLKDLKAAGFSPAEIMKSGGYSLKDLNAAGFTAKQLAKVGFTASQLKRAGILTDKINPNKELKKQCSVKQLQKDRLNGFSAKHLRENGCGLAALKSAGFSADDLKAAGYNAAQLKKAGFSAAQLKDAGFSAAQLKNAGFNAKDLKKAGFTAGQLKNAGFNAGQLAAAGFDAKSLAAVGFTAKQLRKAGFDAAALKAAGFSASALKDAGFSKGDLLRAGFSPIQAGYIVPKKIKPVEVLTKRQITKPRLSASTVTSSMPSINSLSSEDKLRRIAELQQQAMSRQQRQDQIAQMQGAMMGQGQQLMGEWSAGQNQAMVVAAHVVNPVSNGGDLSKDSPFSGPIFKAGTVMFAVIDTSINSDEKSPIMAHIVDGPLKGAKLLGNFTLVKNKLLINFSVLNIPSYKSSIGINSVAIDPEEARTAIAGDVDNHYLLRYGSLFAASFLQGIGSSLQSVTSTVIASPIFGAVTVKNPPNMTQAAIEGAGKAGSAIGSELAPNFNTPPTIRIQSGTGIGLLIMSDLRLTKALPKTEEQAAMGNRYNVNDN